MAFAISTTSGSVRITPLSSRSELDENVSIPIIPPVRVDITVVPVAKASTRTRENPSNLDVDTREIDDWSKFTVWSSVSCPVKVIDSLESSSSTKLLRLPSKGPSPPITNFASLSMSLLTLAKSNALIASLGFF